MLVQQSMVLEFNWVFQILVRQFFQDPFINIIQISKFNFNLYTKIYLKINNYNV
jgi:hypothetical protein